MMKAIATLADGRLLLILGLSNANLEELLRKPLDTMIRVDGKELAIGIDVVLCSGRTEAELLHAFEKMIGPGTKLKIDRRLTS